MHPLRGMSLASTYLYCHSISKYWNIEVRVEISLGFGNVSNLDPTYIVIQYSNIGIVRLGLRSGLLGTSPFLNVCCHSVSGEAT
jgi:hypothetical protein